jgi:hypothetical protein
LLKISREGPQQWLPARRIPAMAQNMGSRGVSTTCNSPIFVAGLLLRRNPMNLMVRTGGHESPVHSIGVVLEVR